MRDEGLEQWKYKSIAQKTFTLARQAKPKLLKASIIESALSQFTDTAKAEEGTRRHKLIEDYLNSRWDRSEVQTDDPMLQNLDEYLEAYGIEPVHTELEVESARSIGHIDLVGLLSTGDPVVVDFKTGRWKGFVSIVQLGGYMSMTGARHAHLVYINDYGFEVVEIEGSRAEHAVQVFEDLEKTVYGWDDLEEECLYI